MFWEKALLVKYSRELTKKTGAFVAIKTFKGAKTKFFKKHLEEGIKKEDACLKKLNHPNVIKSFGIKRDGSGQMFIAMEFCEQGNLSESIGPNGLKSTDFFNLCASITSAIHYLYKMNVVHRDLKPDNILIAGSAEEPQYKIGDFGFARNIELDEQFGTACGTFEYLHPHIFAKCFQSELGINPPMQTFGFSHQLWSIGVLLYEAATGGLPFNPTNGRKSIKVMYKMISEKKNCDISAKEMKTKRGSEITWQHELPEKCSIEKKDRVVHFLAGLLKVSDVLLLFFSTFLF